MPFRVIGYDGQRTAAIAGRKEKDSSVETIGIVLWDGQALAQKEKYLNLLMEIPEGLE